MTSWIIDSTINTYCRICVCSGSSICTSIVGLRPGKVSFFSSSSSGAKVLKFSSCSFWEFLVISSNCTCSSFLESNEKGDFWAGLINLLRLLLCILFNFELMCRIGFLWGFTIDCSDTISLKLGISDCKCPLVLPILASGSNMFLTLSANLCLMFFFFTILGLVFFRSTFVPPAFSFIVLRFSRGTRGGVLFAWFFQLSFVKWTEVETHSIWTVALI